MKPDTEHETVRFQSVVICVKNFTVFVLKINIVFTDCANLMYIR